MSITLSQQDVKFLNSLPETMRVEAEKHLLATKLASQQEVKNRREVFNFSISETVYDQDLGRDIPGSGWGKAEGLGSRFPTSLPLESWLIVLDQAEAIRKFCTDPANIAKAAQIAAQREVHNKEQKALKRAAKSK